MNVIKWILAGVVTIIIIGGAYITLSQSGESDYAAHMSPDGSQLLFYSYRNGDGRIFLMDADGSNIRKMDYGKTPGSHVEPKWSPNGNKIAFTSQGAGKGIYTVNTDGTVVKLIIDKKEGYVHFSSWSADGRKIYFNGSFEKNQSDNIYMANADGSDITKLTNANQNQKFFKPKVSPDGSTIFFSCENQESKNALFKMNSDGSNVQQLTQYSEDFGFPNISPDGTLLVARSAKEGNNELYLLSIAGEVIKRLTNSNVREYFPEFTIDGKHILFSARKKNIGDIMKIDIEGGIVQNLTNNMEYK